VASLDTLVSVLERIARWYSSDRPEERARNLAQGLQVLDADAYHGARQSLALGGADHVDLAAAEAVCAAHHWATGGRGDIHEVVAYGVPVALARPAYRSVDLNWRLWTAQS
jgi:hypothetical protein